MEVLLKRSSPGERGGGGGFRDAVRNAMLNETMSI